MYTCVHVHVCIHKHYLQVHHPEFSFVRLGIKLGLKERWVVSIGLVPFWCSDVSVWLQRLLVCLEESIYIHNIKDMKLLKTILDVPANPTGELPNETGAPSSRVQVPPSLSWEPEAVVLLYNSSSLTPRLCFNGGRFKYIRLCALQEAVWPSRPPTPETPFIWARSQQMCQGVWGRRVGDSMHLVRRGVYP